MQAITSKAVSIYFLLRAKNGLAILWKLRKIKQEKKNRFLISKTVRNLSLLLFKKISTFKVNFSENYHKCWSSPLMTVFHFLDFFIGSFSWKGLYFSVGVCFSFWGGGHFWVVHWWLGCFIVFVWGAFKRNGMEGMPPHSSPS